MKGNRDVDDEDGQGCTGWHTGTLGVTTLNAFKGTDELADTNSGKKSGLSSGNS